MTLPITFTIAGIALIFSSLGVMIFVISKFVPWEWHCDQKISGYAEKSLLIAALLFCVSLIVLIVSVLLTGEML